MLTQYKHRLCGVVNCFVKGSASGECAMTFLLHTFTVWYRNNLKESKVITYFFIGRVTHPSICATPRIFIRVRETGKSLAPFIARHATRSRHAMRCDAVRDMRCDAVRWLTPPHPLFFRGYYVYSPHTVEGYFKHSQFWL